MANWKRYKSTTYKVEPKTHEASGKRYYAWRVVSGTRVATGNATTYEEAETDAQNAIDRRFQGV